jgi:hypothetical protein
MECVYCAVRTESLNIFQVSFRPYGVKRGQVELLVLTHLVQFTYTVSKE